jgi:hypothetical protein
MKIGTGFQGILGFFLSSFKGCIVGVADGRDLRSLPFRWAQMACIYIPTKFHEDWFRHSKVVRRDTQIAR